jgi:glycosyltransferase involved in cell wall biosynthesis
MSEISVVINTFNAEKYLKTVLDFVKGFDEILICDMHSTDKTIEIAQQYGARIIYHENTGYVEPARTFAIQSAKYEWVLVVDADEIVPPALKDYLYECVGKPTNFTGIRIPFKYYFMGRFMRCSYPNHLLRFFRKEETTWPPTIHSHPVVNGKIQTIPANRKDLAFIHLENDRVDTFVRKMNIYTDFEIERRKNRRYNYFSLPAEAMFRFFKFFILKGAIWDGKPGLIFAGLLSMYKYVSIAKVWETRYKYPDMDNDVKKISHTI